MVEIALKHVMEITVKSLAAAFAPLGAAFQGLEGAVGDFTSKFMQSYVVKPIMMAPQRAIFVTSRECKDVVTAWAIKEGRHDLLILTKAELFKLSMDQAKLNSGVVIHEGTVSLNEEEARKATTLNIKLHELEKARQEGIPKELIGSWDADLSKELDQ